MDKCVDLVGTPFVYGGRGPDSFDCYGLVMECSKRNGIILPDFGFADNQALIAAMMGATMPQWEECPREAGAVALFRIGRFISHCGFLMNPDFMLHTWHDSGGVLIERVDVWKQRTVGFFKYVGN